MNDLPRHTLSRIILEHGRSICDTPKRVEALLRDLCGAHRREINIIIGALEERVAADMLLASETTPRGVLLARLAARLRDNLAYTPEAARWGVESWAVALGIMSEAELKDRERAESTGSGQSGAASSIQEAQPPATKPARPPAPPSQPPRGTSPAPSRQASLPTQKASPPPTVIAPPAPRRMPTQPGTPSRPTRQNVAPPPTPPPPKIDAPRRGLTLRGCLLVVVLMIALIVAAVFVVPAVVMILKEEQAQPSINDPRIR